MTYKINLNSIAFFDFSICPFSFIGDTHSSKFSTHCDLFGGELHRESEIITYQILKSAGLIQEQP